MNIFQAIIYGIVQGIGEFLPISSSGHLIALPQILGWDDPGLAFDVALHLGTLVAVIAFFWKDWVTLIKAGITDYKSKDGKLFWYIIAASIPGGIIGILLEKKAENAFRSLLLVGIMLIVMGLVMYIADKIEQNTVDVDNIGLGRSFIIGLSQAIAVIPGVSRSGITMSTGLFAGLTKEGAARFSFLLSTPLIIGAGILKMPKLIHNTSAGQVPAVIVAIVTSAIVGFLSIKFLLNYLKKKGFGIFVVYRIIVGIAFIAIFFIRK